MIIDFLRTLPYLQTKRGERSTKPEKNVPETVPEEPRQRMNRDNSRLLVTLDSLKEATFHVEQRLQDMRVLSSLSHRGLVAGQQESLAEEHLAQITFAMGKMHQVAVEKGLIEAPPKQPPSGLVTFDLSTRETAAQIEALLVDNGDFRDQLNTAMGRLSDAVGVRNQPPPNDAEVALADAHVTKRQLQQLGPSAVTAQALFRDNVSQLVP